MPQKDDRALRGQWARWAAEALPPEVDGSAVAAATELALLALRRGSTSTQAAQFALELAAPALSAPYGPYGVWASAFVICLRDMTPGEWSEVETNGGIVGSEPSKSRDVIRAGAQAVSAVATDLSEVDLLTRLHADVERTVRSASGATTQKRLLRTVPLPEDHIASRVELAQAAAGALVVSRGLPFADFAASFVPFFNLLLPYDVITKDGTVDACLQADVDGDSLSSREQLVVGVIQITLDIADRMSYPVDGDLQPIPASLRGDVEWELMFFFLNVIDRALWRKLGEGRDEPGHEVTDLMLEAGIAKFATTSRQAPRGDLSEDRINVLNERQMFYGQFKFGAGPDDLKNDLAWNAAQEIAGLLGCRDNFFFLAPLHLELQSTSFSVERTILQLVS